MDDMLRSSAAFEEEALLHLQWFPGHMAKTRRLIAEHLKLVDAAVELIDARIPRSSRNPVIDELLAAKPRLILINKSDLADPVVNRAWCDHFAAQGIPAVLLDSMTGRGYDTFKNKIRSILRDKLSRDADKGMQKKIRLMVVGIPNVGKSSFINRLSGSRRAKVEDRPGVTRGKQWIDIKDGFQLLDTPGILWPKFEDREVALDLAFTGAIKDDITDVETVASLLLLRLYEIVPELVGARYKVAYEGEGGYELLEKVGRKRGFLISGGEVDLERTARIVLDEFRSAKIGRISLERPEDCNGKE